jgi:hypothetical protein
VPSRILDGVTSSLSTIPIDRRRQLAATIGLFAVLFVAVGAVAATGRATAIVRVFSAVAILAAVLLGLIAWGVLHSVTADLADADLDAAITDAITSPNGGLAGESTGLSCGCGHDHDAAERHVSGTDCAHSCDACLFTALRPSPSRSRAERLAQ